MGDGVSREDEHVGALFRQLLDPCQLSPLPGEQVDVGQMQDPQAPGVSVVKGGSGIAVVKGDCVLCRGGERPVQRVALFAIGGCRARGRLGRLLAGGAG